MLFLFFVLFCLLFCSFVLCSFYFCWRLDLAHLHIENMVFLNFVVVWSPSNVWLFVNPGTVSCQASPSLIISWSLLKFMSIELVMPSNHIVLCRPLLLLPSIFPSIRVFFNVSALCIRWPKYWSFRFSISPSSEYSGLIAFRMDWFDLRAAQIILKSLLQQHSWKASVLQYSNFFMIQLSHPYMTTASWKRN